MKSDPFQASPIHELDVKKRQQNQRIKPAVKPQSKNNKPWKHCLKQYAPWLQYLYPKHQDMHGKRDYKENSERGYGSDNMCDKLQKKARFQHRVAIRIQICVVPFVPKPSTTIDN
jgi:hypothetical protein